MKLLAVLGLALSSRASAQTSTVTFVTNAFQAVGVNPSCTQVSLANDSLIVTNSRLDAAKRLVSLLFEDPASLDGQLSYEPTTAYTAHHGYAIDDQGFVLDLYAAFLQRPADPGGLSFWVSQAPVIGYKRMIDAQANSQEFSNLVSSLQPTGICCPVACRPGSGMAWNPATCACQ